MPLFAPMDKANQRHLEPLEASSWLGDEHGAAPCESDSSQSFSGEAKASLGVALCDHLPVGKTLCQVCQVTKVTKARAECKTSATEFSQTASKQATSRCEASLCKRAMRKRDGLARFAGKLSSTQCLLSSNV